ncbi:MAG: GTPase [Bacillota bacterium]
MEECMVIGRPNAGKTCFVLNFAEYMGLKKLKLYKKQTAGYTTIQNYGIDEARNKLISKKSNYTKNLQSIKITIPKGKVKKTLKIVDSCGIKNGIHPDPGIREAMANTIKNIKKANLILHIIDISRINPQSESILTSVDKMIYNYSRIENNYVILLNKIDLEKYKKNIDLIKKHYHSQNIVSISALYKKGFKNVKKMVLKYV